MPDYTGWGPGQPDDIEAQPSDCVLKSVFKSDRTNLVGWHDAECDRSVGKDVSFHALCEYDKV